MGKNPIVFGFLAFLMMGTAYASETALHAPQVPKSLQNNIDRVIPSQEGDLFVVLKDGMTVLIRERPGEQVVSAQVLVRAGSIYEGQSPGAGLSHYLEHLVAGGTNGGFGKCELKERYEQLGGEGNAFTSYDRTGYFVSTTAEKWKPALNLLIESVRHCRLDDREVEQEKPVIRQEAIMTEDDPSRGLWQLFIETAYRNHPVRYPIIGIGEIFDLQTRENLVNYYKAMYRPQNMILAVVGNVNALEVLQFVCEHMDGSTRSVSPPPYVPPEPAQEASRWVEKELSTSRLTKAAVGFPAVSSNDRDVYALDVLALLLGEGKAARLIQRIKEQDDRVLEVRVSNWSPSFVQGQFLIYLDLAPDGWPDILTRLKEELERFKVEPLDQDKLEKAKKRVIAQHLFEKQSAFQMASSLASSFLDSGDPYDDSKYVEKIRSVTAEQVLEAARRYIDWNRVNIAVIKPPASTNSQSEAAKRSGTEKTGKVTRQELENGLKLLLKEDPALPLVTIRLDGLGGVLLEGSNEAGLSNLTSSLMTGGTPARNKLDIVDAIEGAGGMILCGSYLNTYSITIKVLKEDLDTALDILADILQNARFPEEEVEKKRKETLLEIAKLGGSSEVQIEEHFRKTFFGSHPYGHQRLGTPELVKSYTRQDLLAFYQRMVVPNHAALAVYGDINADKVLTELASKLKGWRPQPLDLPKGPAWTRPAGSDKLVAATDDKATGAILVGMNGLDVNDRDCPTLDVLKAVLSGVGDSGGRLFDALRGGENKLVYLIEAFTFYGVKTGCFEIISQGKTDTLDEIQKIIEAELEKLIKDAVSEQELERTKEMIITFHRMRMENLDAQAQSAALNEVLGIGWDYDNRYEELIRKVRAEDVKSLAARILSHRFLVRSLPRTAQDS